MSDKKGNTSSPELVQLAAELERGPLSEHSSVRSQSVHQVTTANEVAVDVRERSGRRQS